MENKNTNKSSNIQFAKFLVLCILFLSSCKKKESTEPTPDPIIPGKKTVNLTKGLIFSYDFNGNIADSSSNAIDLSNSSSGYTFVNDRNNNSNEAVSFAGTGELVLPTSSLYKLQFPFTVSMWVNLASPTDDANNRLFYSDISSTYYGIWIQTTGANGTLAFSFGDGTGASSSSRNTVVTSKVLTSNNWHHILARFKGKNNIEVFVDGDKDTNTSYSGSANTIMYTTSPGSIGRLPGYSNYFTGKIDKVRMWSRSINDKEVTEEYMSVE